MLLFNRLKACAGRRSHGGAGGSPRASSAGARDHDASDNYAFSTTSRWQRIRLHRFWNYFSQRGLQERSMRSSMRGLGLSVEPGPSPPTDPGNSLESFSAVTNHGTSGAVKRDDIPNIVACKIQCHHELWHRVAFGRPSEGFMPQPAMDAASSPTRSKHTDRWSPMPFSSWPSPPRLFADGCSPTQSDGQGSVPSMDYSSAKELTLSTTYYTEKDILRKENALPQGAPRFTIHPYDRRKVAWDTFVAVLILYGCVNIPLRIGFDLEAGLMQVVTDGTVDVMFFLDMIFSFRTAFFAPDGDLVTKSGDIAVRYLKGNFTIDLMSTVPLDLVMLAWGGGVDILRSTRLLRTLRLLRLVRLLKLSSSLGREEDNVATIMHPSLWALTKMIVMLLFIAHLMGCMWGWVAILRPDDVTWIIAYGLEDTPWAHQYLVGVYWAFTTMTTVGYGDITSVTDLERIFAIMGMIIGATVFGYIIGNVAVIMENFDVVDSIESGKINQIQDWLYDRKFPAALAEKVRRQYRYIYKELSVFDNSEILDAMPGVMSTSMLYAQHRAITTGLKFLEKRPPLLVCGLIRRMVPCFALSGDILYLEHEVGGHWYLLHRGEVSFYVSVTPLGAQSEVVHMRSLSGDGHFGLTPVLLNVLNMETATATAMTDLLTIRKDDLVEILQQWPEVMMELTIEAERSFRDVEIFKMARQGRRSSRRRNHRRKSDAKSTEEPGVGNAPINSPRSCVVISREATSPRILPSPARSKRTHFVDPETSTCKEEDDAHGAAVGGAELSNAVASVVGDTKVEEDVESGTEAPDDSVVSAAADPEVDPDPVGPMSSEGAGEKHPPRHRAGDNSPGVRLTRVDSLELSRKGASLSEGLSSHSADGRSDWPGGGEEDSRPLKLEASEGMGLGRPQRPVGERAAEAMDLRALRLTRDSPPQLPRLAPGKLAAEEIKTREPSDVEEIMAVTTEVVANAATDDYVKHFWREPHDVADFNSKPEIIGGRDDGAYGSARAAERPKDMRRCFVAKTFSPSDLGLENIREEASGDAEKHGGQRPNTIIRGLSKLGIASLACGDLRKASIDEVFGFDETQTVLGGVPPERLFSLTGMFHPEAPLKISWDLWMSLVIVWSVVEVTFRLGFDRPATGGWIILSYVTEVLFFLDILVTFRTALLTRDGNVVAEKEQVVMAYLKGWFIIDVVSTVPWDSLVTEIAGENPSATSSTRLIRSLRLARLVRIVRLLKIPDFMEEWEANSPFGPSGVRLLRLIVLMVFLAHINACVWYAAGLHSTSGHSWIQDYICADQGFPDECPDNQRSFSLYLASIYFSFTTMTTTGYGDIVPNRFSTEELTVAIASEVIGATMFAWLIGNLVNLVLNLDPAERNRKSMMAYLTEYLRVVPLSSKAKKTIARNYAFHLEVHSVFNQSSILGDLIPHLQNQAYVFLWRSLLPKIPFLCSMEDQITGFVRVVLPLLKPATFAVGDVIVTPRVGTRDMSFIISGMVEVRLAKRIREYTTKELGERSHFGEMFMLLPEHVPFRGLARVHATSSRVRLMQLTRGAFTTLESRHPHISSFMAKQLFDPNASASWVVVSDEFKCEVKKLEENETVSVSNMLETPRNPEGVFLERFRQEKHYKLPSPRGSFMVRKRLSPARVASTSPVGVAAPRQPATQKVLKTKASRMMKERIAVKK